MHIIITSATADEAISLKEKLREMPIRHHHIEFHVSGVGILLSTYSLTQLLTHSQPDLIIQCGIAGTYGNCTLGQVVVVHSEILGSFGVMEKEQWQDMFEAGFVPKNVSPFLNKELPNPWLQKFSLPLQKVQGITVDEVTTRNDRITAIKKLYNGETESMEGAAFHYVCLQHKIPFIQLRGISNMVGDRNKKQWKIAEANSNITQTIAEYVRAL